MTAGDAGLKATALPRRHGWKTAMGAALAAVVMAATARVAAAQGDVAGEATVMGLCTREPRVRVDCYPPVANFPNATEEACRAQGCCWKALDNDGVPCAFDAIGAPDDARCAKVSNASRLACRNPRFAERSVVGGDEETCRAVGCCFDVDNDACFQPFFEGYELLSLEETVRGWRGALVLRRFLRGPFGNDVALLELHVIKESTSRVRVRITDPSFPRYEVPGGRGVYDDGEDDEDKNDSDDGMTDSKGAEAHDEDKRAVVSDYHVHFYERPFGIAVTRRKTHEVLFNSTPSVHAATSFNGLVFENQFLEISTHLERHETAGAPVLFGLGERWGSARLRVDRKGDHYPMFSRRARDVTPHTREGGDNLGGVHPFYLHVLSSGRSHGVFFRSSNAMEVVTQDSALTFRSTGGVFDFTVFSGPTALDVTSEYTKSVGRPEMPPFWALGYHFGKQGQHSLEDATVQVAGLRAAGVPLDVYWQDADYMYDGEAFSLNERYFPLEETRSFVDDLHFNNQYYMALMKPAIPTEPESPAVDHALIIDGEGSLSRGGSGSDGNKLSVKSVDQSHYYPLDEGRLMNVFVKGIQGQTYAEKLVGTQWSAFVDFSNPNASAYWHDMLGSFHEQVVPFDGVWVDTDEPSSSCDVAFSGPGHACESEEEGSRGRSGDRKITMANSTQTAVDRGVAVGDGSFVRTQDVAFPFDPYRQPFVPGQNTNSRGGHGNLNAVTLPMAALHHASLHYNVHSIYGHQQAKTTRKALDDVLKRRSIAMSRATYAGDGKYAGQLSSDVDATWENMRLSIASVVQMSLLGIPFSGPSVGGNGRGMTKELSIRWNQAASFFPLFRNHVSRDAEPQSPIDFDQDTASIVREVTLRRYSYLAYMYSQFYHAHVNGHSLIRALALEFPNDPAALDIETQYLVGPALMVSPVVDESSISVRVYFPNATWYDLESGRMMITLAKDDELDSSRYVKLLSPLPMLQVHVRGGYIIPAQEPSTTTAMTKRGVYRLVVALDPSVADCGADGDLFVDDGDSLHSVREERYSVMRFKARVTGDNTFQIASKRAFHGYDGPEMHVDLEKVIVFGLRGNFLANSSLHVHGSSEHDNIKAEYFEQADMLVLTQMKASIGDELDLRVEAKNAVAENAGEEEGGADVGVEHSSDYDHVHAGDDEEEGRGEAEAHGGKEHGQGGEDEGPSPITGEQHKKKGMPWWVILLILAAVGVFATFAYILYRRRRSGYNPIT